MIDATTTIGTGPNAITIHGSTAVDIDRSAAPHLPLGTDDDELDRTPALRRVPEPIFNDPGNLQDNSFTGATPSTISRSGTLTPIGNSDAHLVEDVARRTRSRTTRSSPTSAIRRATARSTSPRSSPRSSVTRDARTVAVRDERVSCRPAAPVRPDQWTFGADIVHDDGLDDHGPSLQRHRERDELRVLRRPDLGVSPSPEFCFPANHVEPGRARPARRRLVDRVRRPISPRISRSASSRTARGARYNYCGPVETLPMRGESIAAAHRRAPGRRRSTRASSRRSSPTTPTRARSTSATAPTRSRRSPRSSARRSRRTKASSCTSSTRAATRTATSSRGSGTSATARRAPTSSPTTSTPTTARTPSRSRSPTRPATPTRRPSTRPS